MPVATRIMAMSRIGMIPRPAFTSIPLTWVGATMAGFIDGVVVTLDEVVGLLAAVAGCVVAVGLDVAAGVVDTGEVVTVLDWGLAVVVVVPAEVLGGTYFGQLAAARVVPLPG
jgi:hypothetical protein